MNKDAPIQSANGHVSLAWPHPPHPQQIRTNQHQVEGPGNNQPPHSSMRQVSPPPEPASQRTNSHSDANDIYETRRPGIEEGEEEEEEEEEEEDQAHHSEAAKQELARQKRGLTRTDSFTNRTNLQTPGPSNQMKNAKRVSLASLTTLYSVSFRIIKSKVILLTSKKMFTQRKRSML